MAARNLILGSAAALMLVSGAQAADLPVKAKAVEYVRICTAYGAGFFYIPGTDTCIKLGGYLRVDTTFNGGAHGAPAWNGDLGQQNRFRDYFLSRSRMALTVDTRTATEYGVVRTFGHGNFQFQNFGNTNPAGSVGTQTTGLSSALLSTAGGGYVAVEYLFIQFAGFTFGKSSSAYSTPWNGFPGNINANLLGGNNTDTGVNNIQYTAQFGNGVSASIGLDDPTVWNRTAVYNLSIPAAIGANGTGSNAYAGMHAPDIVGNIRVDQAWGLLQFSAAAHEVSGSYNTLAAGAAPNNLSEISGHPDSKWGGSVMAAVADQEHPDRCRRRHQVRCDLRQGHHQERDRHQRHLAELRDVQRQRLRLPERRLWRDHRRRLFSWRCRYRRSQAHDGLGYSRCLQPQLESVLVDQPVRKLLRRSL